MSCFQDNENIFNVYESFLCNKKGSNVLNIFTFNNPLTPPLEETSSPDPASKGEPNPLTPPLKENQTLWPCL